MTDPETKVSGLAKIIKEDRGILRCPADTGYSGADYELTSPNHTCYSSFGQSYTYNNSLYTDVSSPYYGEGPIRYGQVKNPEQVVLVSDFSSVWHGAAGSGSKGAKYFLNIMYFDGHVQGKAFTSDQEAKTYRNDNSRWWD
jgi:prepilin-type processing-associated H-X9-DG protein